MTVRLVAHQTEPDPVWDYQHDHACCAARVDSIGRWPVGWCSETCTRRPKVSAPTGRIKADTAHQNGGPGGPVCASPPTRGTNLNERSMQ